MDSNGLKNGHADQNAVHRNATELVKQPVPELVLVDDDSLTLEIVTWNMRKASCIAQLFSDPEKALSHLEQSVPQLLIVDYYMPRMTGVEFLERAGQVCSLESSTIFLCSAITQKQLPSELTAILNVQQLDKNFVCDRELLNTLLLKHVG